MTTQQIQALSAGKCLPENAVGHPGWTDEQDCNDDDYTEDDESKGKPRLRTEQNRNGRICRKRW